MLEIRSILTKISCIPPIILNWKFEDMKPTSMKPQQNVGMSVYSLCHQHPLFIHINNQSNISQRPLHIKQVGRLEQRCPLLEDGLVNEQHMSLCTCHSHPLSYTHTHTHIMASMDIWGAFVKGKKKLTYLVLLTWIWVWSSSINPSAFVTQRNPHCDAWDRRTVKLVWMEN